MRPLLETIDDPAGSVLAIPLDVIDAGEADEYLVKRIQEMRWELWALLGQVGDVTDATSRLIPQVIEDLGIVARAEAARHDSVS